MKKTKNIFNRTTQRKRICIEENILYLQEEKSYDMAFFNQTLKFFYNAVFEKTSRDQIGERARDSANFVIRNMTNGEVIDYLKTDAKLTINPPLSFVSSSYFRVSFVLVIYSS